eukprot:maker-scaffold742_size103727-snap-gene-0.22 protein:Tk09081 transcript:maker-scaffold742_size103727-snap-gene-0.22-mRNA-1 annotation:"hypothetical protein"
MYGIEGYRGLGLLIVAILTLQPQSAEGNIRCYSCAPCNEFEYFAGDLSAFETDCLADRSCLKLPMKASWPLGLVTVVHGGVNWAKLLQGFMPMPKCAGVYLSHPSPEIRSP